MSAWLMIAAAVSEPSNVSPAAIQQPKTHLQGVTATEANGLVGKLQHAQEEVRAGRNETFEILAGAPAMYAAARVPPLTAFLQMSFERPWSIEAKPPTGLWHPYELTYFPPGPHSLMWKVTVTVGVAGELERVEMLYTAPPPF